MGLFFYDNLLPIRLINSARVFWSLKDPNMALDVATEFCFSTPRIIMHMCLASVTIPTPCGSSYSMIVSPI
jgi:hypothetical protein